MKLRRIALFAALAAALPAQVTLTTNPYAFASQTGQNVVKDASGGLWSLSVFDDGSASPGNRPLLLLNSTDGGQTWNTHPFTFNDAASGLNPPNPANGCTLAIDSTGTLHAVWGRYYYPTYYREYYRNYNPVTTAASNVLDLSAYVGSTAASGELAIAIDAADTVWISAQGASSWVSRLLRSNLPGASDLTFTNVGNISPSASSQRVELAIDTQGRVHCAFYRNTGPGEYHHRIYDPVTGWGAAVSIGNGTTAPHDYTGRLAADALGNVHALVGVDTGTPAATWSFEYRRWDATSGWSAPVVLTTATQAQYTGIANYYIIALACDEATGKAYAFYRDLAAGGALRLAEKGLGDPAFTNLPDIMPANAGAHAYYVPGARGSLYPSFNMTGTDLDLTWQLRATTTPPYSWMFTRVSTGAPSASLVLSAPAVLGTVTTIDLTAAGDPSGGYLCGLSLGTVPGIVLPDLRVIPLNFDAVLTLTLTPGNGILANNTGVLSPSGQASVIFAVPNFPPLLGLTVYAAFVVADALNPTGIGTISPALPITLQ